ncbi:MAG: bifunctional (p)ppGpp synthetase/guanosine-3',5'-bis(diphosphate) 3'-pyrophosphohydrolase [Victivallales bacterium]|nr:bifunctional (p)ppGpp synthetase/guanosine-3',5'-bis(diphosphate) 3'-pyrophosphohydrolase [Victivallales bacterium]
MEKHKTKQIDTSLVDKAIIYAVNAHKGVPRRGRDFPYIVHPLEALTIVATMTSEPELLAAAVLHDVVEDTPCTVEDIRREFGDRVADLVDAETEKHDSSSRSREESWHDRKNAALEELKHAGRDVKIVALGDKLSNMRAIARDYVRYGDDFWQQFHAKDPRSHAWRFRALVEAMAELKGMEAYEEFAALVEKVFTAACK